jgi:hypothetical protein
VNNESRVGSWVPIVAVSGGALGIIVGGLTLATFKPSFRHFLEKHLPVLKPVLSSLHVVKETTTGDGIRKSNNNAEDVQGELDKTTGYEAKSDVVTSEYLPEKEETLLDSTVEAKQSSRSKSDDQFSNELFQTKPVVADQITTEKTHAVSPKDSNDTEEVMESIAKDEKDENETNGTNTWLNDVSEVLKVTAIQATDYAVNQHHILQQCVKEKAEVINSALANAPGSEEKQKSTNQMMMAAQTTVEQVKRILTVIFYIKCYFYLKQLLWEYCAMTENNTTTQHMKLQLSLLNPVSTTT